MITILSGYRLYIFVILHLNNQPATIIQKYLEKKRLNNIHIVRDWLNVIFIIIIVITRKFLFLANYYIMLPSIHNFTLLELGRGWIY